MSAQHSVFEEIPVAGHKLVDTVRRVVRAGNVRRIVVRNAADRVLLDMPLTAGVVGAALLPFWAALGGLAALTAHYTVVIERDGDATSPARASSAGPSPAP